MTFKLKIRRKEYELNQNDVILHNGNCIQVLTRRVWVEKFYQSTLKIPKTTWEKIKNNFCAYRYESVDGIFTGIYYKLKEDKSE